MDKKDYEREAELLAELASLAMKEGNYKMALEYLDSAKTAIEKAQKEG